MRVPSLVDLPPPVGVTHRRPQALGVVKEPLKSARHHYDQQACRVVLGSAEGMHGAGRDDHRRARGQGVDLLIDLEDELPLEDVEELGQLFMVMARWAYCVRLQAALVDGDAP